MRAAAAPLQPILARLLAGASLSEPDAAILFESVIAGTATQAQVGAALMAMAARGETVAELTAAVRVLRDHAIPISAADEAIDCCGTGGDGHGTLNISTAVSFVVASCGVTVAKHGNRAASSRSGTADVLAVLGVESQPSPEAAQRMLDRHGIAFLFAPNHHPALAAVGAVRRELGFRTIFNLAAPLANPARTQRQLVGVYHARWLEPVAETLQRLGSTDAWVVHGSDGLDELTITGPSEVAILKGGRVERRTVTPEEAGLGRAPLAAIIGGDPPENAAALRRLFDGETGAYRDVVLLNAAAALMVAGKVASLKDGAALAARVIDEGRPRALLTQMAAEATGKAA